MSAEKIIIDDTENFINSKNLEINKKVSNRPVDINHLLARARKENQKEYKINLVFFGLFASLVLIVGILLSL